MRFEVCWGIKVRHVRRHFKFNYNGFLLEDALEDQVRLWQVQLKFLYNQGLFSEVDCGI